jgi:hypothetical protein
VSSLCSALVFLCLLLLIGERWDWAFWPFERVPRFARLRSLALARRLGQARRVRGSRPVPSLLGPVVRGPVAPWPEFVRFGR